MPTNRPLRQRLEVKYAPSPDRRIRASLLRTLVLLAVLSSTAQLAGCTDTEAKRGSGAELTESAAVDSVESAAPVQAEDPGEEMPPPALPPAPETVSPVAKPLPADTSRAGGQTDGKSAVAVEPSGGAVGGERAAGAEESDETVEIAGEAGIAAADTSAVKASAPKYRAGEDPDFAARMGWPVESPEPLPGALLPHSRIIAYYGNPLSKRMGILGQYPPEEMLERLDQAVAEWAAADPETPVIPALHLIAVVAQADSGPAGKYRLRMRDTLIERVAEWAETRNALVFLDVQVGLSTLQEELPRLAKFLQRPNFHLGIDPEFSMKDGTPPGKKIGTFDAADINYATEFLAGLVREHEIPPKVLVVHRFTRRMVTNSRDIQLRPEVQVVMHMDGWGAPWLKRDSYRDYIVREPVQYAGFKIFYNHDQREEGWRIMSPADVLRLRPIPVYIQYQ